MKILCIREAAKNIIKRILSLYSWDQWARKSWSQEGEDLILQKIFKGKKNGFYVDVGAHHPKRFSNTYLFYLEGWCGINIDALPGSMQVFNKIRPRDRNLEIGIADQRGELDYFIFNEPALNGFCPSISAQRSTSGGLYHIEGKMKIQVYPLRDILEEYVKDRQIDFLSVDVEGLDLQVLKSNDWSNYRPKYILVEILNTKFSELQDSEVTKFLKSKGYGLFLRLVNTAIFSNQEKS